MTTIESLHTFARRYCEEQSQRWRTQYGAIGAKMSSPQGLSTYPRYLVLDAILAQVERKTPSDFTSQAELLEGLLRAGATAECEATRNPAHASGAPHRAIAEERERFCTAMRRAADGAELSEVKAMLFRRTLEETESRKLWEQLQRRWGADGHYWYPLDPAAVSDPMLVFAADRFHVSEGPRALRKILADHQVLRVWELRELRSERELELDLTLFDARYNLSEGYWTAGDMDWLVYASHENSITIAGQWLVADLKSVWLNWEEHLWTAPWNP